MEDQIAASTEAWFATLRERVSEVESDGREAFKQRRQLVRFLVQSITVGCEEDGNARVEVTYRFGPPTAQERIGSPQDEERSCDWCTKLGQILRAERARLVRQQYDSGRAASTSSSVTTG